MCLRNLSTKEAHQQDRFFRFVRFKFTSAELKYCFGQGLKPLALFNGKFDPLHRTVGRMIPSDALSANAWLDVGNPVFVCPSSKRQCPVRLHRFVRGYGRTRVVSNLGATSRERAYREAQSRWHSPAARGATRLALGSVGSRQFVVVASSSHWTSGGVPAPVLGARGLS